MIAQDIVIRPIITEKSMQDITAKKYVFEVAKNATKIDVARAVEELFKVKVEKVIKSARNIAGVKTAQVNELNVYDILNADKLIIAQDALRSIEEVYA